MTEEISIVNKDLNQTIEALNKLKEVAIYLSNSDMFVKDFTVYGADGKPIIDETTNKPMINTTDVTLCLMAGHELGLSISGSLLYGKKLNQATYMAVMKGRSLGLDVATAIEKVVSIPTQNGYVSYTMVDIISAKLIQGGVEFLPFIKNYAPFYIYKNGATGEELDLDKILDPDTDDLIDSYFVAILGVENNQTVIKNKEAVEKAKSEGKTIVTKQRHGYYSKAKFTRKLGDRTQTIYQRFSTLDAERAGLLPTWDDKGNMLTKGKNNWITNTPQMMNNRVISIAGRIIGADLINGVYTREEVVSAGIVDEKDAPIIDTTIEVIN